MVAKEWCYIKRYPIQGFLVPYWRHCLMSIILDAQLFLLWLLTVHSLRLQGHVPVHVQVWPVYALMQEDTPGHQLVSQQIVIGLNSFQISQLNWMCNLWRIWSPTNLQTQRFGICQYLYFVPVDATVVPVVWVYTSVLLWCYHWGVLHLQTGTTPLGIACQEGHLPVVQHLIAAKAEINHQAKVAYLPCIVQSLLSIYVYTTYI